MLIAFKRIMRIRQEYFAAYGKYADRHKTEPIPANFRPKPKKFQILNHHSIHYRIGKKPISRYCPLKGLLQDEGRADISQNLCASLFNKDISSVAEPEPRAKNPK